ncbi:MAG: hypothetical protein PVH65_00665 [Chloroflexota bacterium]|jgi:hypothetical protein
MLEIEELRNRNPRAWTLLLTQGMGAPSVIVEAVGEEPLSEDGNVSRYLLSLANYQEPISLIGKRTNAVEAMFYEFFAPNLSHFTARCFFQHVGLEDGWLVLPDIRSDHPPETWTANDIGIVIGNLASLHAAYWAKREILDQYGLPLLLEKRHFDRDAGADRDFEDTPGEQPTSQMERIERWLQSQQRILTEHAMRTAGPSLVPLLRKANEGLQILRHYHGWPGIVDDRHLTALADLLDDPMPMLYPLRQLPCTLLHGDPSAKHWRLTLFDDYYLMNWQMMTIGPGVYDLVRFIDQAVLLPGDRANGEILRSETAEETMIDNYILAMRGELGTRFDARSTRLAIPAARCLLAIIDWLPRLSGWLEEMSFDKEVWQAMSKLPDDALKEAGMAELISWRRSLALIFDRFLRAYRLL